jgi:hypothetical protein
MNVAMWRIGRLALVVACMGLLALSTPQRAGAADSNPSSNGTAQVRWCEAMGGTATVEEYRTNAGGQTMTMVTCTGGLGGSWHCVNFVEMAPDCQGSRVSFPDWDDMEEMEETPPQAQADPDDDEKQDTNKSKGKKHKKGKKGGKGRKK